MTCLLAFQNILQTPFLKEVSNDLLEGTRESVWTCACPRLVESGIRAELERNGTIALAFGLKPALRSDYISHAPLPARSAPLTCPDIDIIFKLWYGIRLYCIYRYSSNLCCDPCSRRAAGPELSALLPAPLLLHAQRGEGLEQTLRHSSTNYCCRALWPWCPMKKISWYGHSGLCAPGPVSVVSLPWSTATRGHSSQSQ